MTSEGRRGNDMPHFGKLIPKVTPCHVKGRRSGVCAVRPNELPAVPHLQPQGRVYGDAAVLSGRLQRTRPERQDDDDDWRFTKVYVRRERRWQAVAFQASEAAQPQLLVRRPFCLAPIVALPD